MGLFVARFGVYLPALWFSEGFVEGYGEKDKILNVPLGYVNSNGEYAIHMEELGKRIQFLLGFSEGLADEFESQC